MAPCAIYRGSSEVEAQPFVDVTTAANLDAADGDYGVAWGDYNGDGYRTCGETTPAPSFCRSTPPWG